MKLLESWEKTETYADILLANLFQQRKISDQDRHFIQEIFFGVLRWRERLNWIIRQLFKGEVKKSPRFVQAVLQMSLYQLIYLSGIPHYAVINEAVKIAKQKGGQYWAGKVNAILRNFLKQQGEIVYPNRESSLVDALAVHYSHPRWLVQRWLESWGEEATIALCSIDNERPALTLRVNQTRISPPLLIARLSTDNITVRQSPFNENFLYADNLPELSQMPEFQEGLFSIQDESAGLACLLLGAQPGEKIFDLCAAPGGKTGYLMEMGKKAAKVFAIDLHLPRLKLVRQNLLRLGFSDSRVIQADGRYFCSQPVDKVLVDAPCSGLGVLAKRVDLRWRRKPEQIKELAKIQVALLKNAASLVKAGGALVYSTCTMEAEENELVVAEFLNQHKNFTIDFAGKYVPQLFVTSDGFIRTFPHKHRLDGSFAARLIKIGE